MNQKQYCDEVVIFRSLQKHANIEKMLDILKLSSFDCNIHSKTNKVDCYKWAINLDKSLESYKPNILDEYSHWKEMS